jgi:hypothetical protein
MRHSIKPRGAAILVLAAVCFGVVAAGGTAAAQDRGPGAGRADRYYGYGSEPGTSFDERGYHRGWDGHARTDGRSGEGRGTAAADRRFGTAADYGYGRLQRDRIGLDAFERGYRMGREDERRRDRAARVGRSDDRADAFASPAWNDADQREAMERLERAAARLREALVLIQRQDPSGRRLEEALEQARQALIRTQNAMTWLPRESRVGEERGYERRSGEGIGAYRASGGWRG